MTTSEDQDGLDAEAPTETAGVRATHENSLLTEYRRLQVLRKDLEAANVRLNDLMETGRRDAILDCEMHDVDPAFDRVIAKEEEILDRETHSPSDLAVKVLVCAENNFEFEALNRALAEDARNILGL